MPKFDYQPYGAAFFDRHLHKLRELITLQSDELFSALGISAPSPTVSTLLHLLANGSASIARLSDDLGYSHQLISQRLAQLSDMGFIERSADPRDKRKKLIRLTRRGRNEAERVDRALPRLAKAIESVFEEIESDVQASVRGMRAALQDQSIVERV